MPDRPAWPEKPELLPPTGCPNAGAADRSAARIALWHALAHIEFVAIDWRWTWPGALAARGREFVNDFLTVAADEAMHFASSTAICADGRGLWRPARA
jgi:uncharacterized ferritin-like protein (DUF455 family)